MSLLRGPGLDSADPPNATKKPGPALKAVIFDMDGVIIDSHPAHRTAWRRFLRELGREVSESELDFILDGRKRADILRYFLGNLTDSELEEQGRRKDEFFKEVSLDVNPVAGVLDFLAQLESRKIPIAIATSATKSRAHSTLSQLGVTERFQVVVTGSDVKQGKPDPAIYRLTCNRLQLPPENVLAVEDAVSGIRAAKSAGLRCIGIAAEGSCQALLDAGAELVIGDFSDISIEQLEAVLAPGR